MGVGAGDVLEAKVEKGKITLTPKASRDDRQREYTPEQRRAIDMRLAKSLAEVEKGLTFGPFDTADEMIASMVFGQNRKSPTDSRML